MKTKVGQIEINFEISGNPDAPVVAMSHSLGSSGIMWKTQLPLLEPHYRVIRIDTRGHGGSSAPEGEYSMDELVADTIGLLDEIRIDKISLDRLVNWWHDRAGSRHLSSGSITEFVSL